MSAFSADISSKPPRPSTETARAGRALEVTAHIVLQPWPTANETLAIACHDNYESLDCNFDEWHYKLGELVPKKPATDVL